MGIKPMSEIVIDRTKLPKGAIWVCDGKHAVVSFQSSVKPGVRRTVEIKLIDGMPHIFVDGVEWKSQ